MWLALEVMFRRMLFPLGDVYSFDFFVMEGRVPVSSVVECLAGGNDGHEFYPRSLQFIR